MISPFIDTEFILQRLETSGGKSTYAPYSSGIGNLRQSSDELTAFNGLQWGELWEMYVEVDSDVVASDKMTIDESDYLVKGVKEESFGGIDYKRLLLVKDKV